MAHPRRQPWIVASATSWAILLVASTCIGASAAPGVAPGDAPGRNGEAGPPASFQPASGPAPGLATLATVRVGIAPDLATWNASQGVGGGDVYVANAGSENVSVLAGLTNVATVNVSAYGHVPYDPIDDPASSSVVLTYRDYTGPHNVSVLHGPVAGGTQAVAQVEGVTANDVPVLGVYDVANASIYLTDNGATVGVAVVGAANATRFATVLTGATSDPRGLAVDPGNGEVYVVDLGVDTVTVVSGVHLLANVTVGALVNSTSGVNESSGGVDDLDYASDIVYDPANGDIYVANAGAGTVSVLNRTTVIATVGVGKLPYALAYDPSDGEVYVTDVLSDAVSVLRGTTLEGTVPVGRYPVDATYDASDGDILVANVGSDNVSALNGTAVAGSVGIGPTPVGSFGVPCAPVSIVYDTVDHDAYVVCEGSGSVTILGTAPGGPPGIPAWGWGLVGIGLVLLVLLAITWNSRRRQRAKPSPQAPSLSASGPGAPDPSSRPPPP